MRPNCRQPRLVNADEKKRNFDLPDYGRQKVRCANPPCGPDSHATDKLPGHVERGLHVHYRFHRDQHYLVDKDKVVIIDEFTARRMPDRHWSDCLHRTAMRT